MTTPEHTLVGIHLALALGFQCRLGWRGVALAGVAANVPDWDGVPMLLDMPRFESGHRVWGHNVLAIVATSWLLGVSQTRWDWLGRFAAWIVPKLKMLPQAPDDLGKVATLRGRSGWAKLLAFTFVATLSQLVHLPCDMVVSGGAGLSDWPIRPWWPIANVPYVYPLIPWGDVGPTLILMTGMIVIAKRGRGVRSSSCCTLAVLVAYLVARGSLATVV